MIWEDLGSPLSKQKTGQVNGFITNACMIFSSWDFKCLRFVPLYTLRVNAFQLSNGMPSQFMCTLLHAAEFNIYWGLGQVLIQLQNAITPEHQAAKAITALFGRPIHGMPRKSQTSQNNIATLRSEELRNPRSQPILEQLGPLRLLRPGFSKNARGCFVPVHSRTSSTSMTWMLAELRSEYKKKEFQVQYKQIGTKRPLFVPRQSLEKQWHITKTSLLLGRKWAVLDVDPHLFPWASLDYIRYWRFKVRFCRNMASVAMRKAYSTWKWRLPYWAARTESTCHKQGSLRKISIIFIVAGQDDLETHDGHSQTFGSPRLCSCRNLDPGFWRSQSGAIPEQPCCCCARASMTLESHSMIWASLHESCPTGGAWSYVCLSAGGPTVGRWSGSVCNQ